MNREAVAARLQELCVVGRGELERFLPAFSGRGEAAQTLPCFHAPEDILILVAGGGGLYTMVMPSWCAGGHRNSAVSVVVETNQFCEVPQNG